MSSLRERERECEREDHMPCCWHQPEKTHLGVLHSCECIQLEPLLPIVEGCS